MAGRGPTPKDPKARQRRNKPSTARTIEASPPKSKVPELPKGRGAGRKGAWSAQTRAWWRDLWRSPLAREYVPDVDVHTLLVLAVVLDQFWREPSKELATEVRLQAREFGLNPMARRSLQWEIRPAYTPPGDKPEQARRPSARSGDPRQRLTVVK